MEERMNIPELNERHCRDKERFSVGCGLADDMTNAATPEDSSMTVYYDVDEEDFRNYATGLKGILGVPEFENETECGSFVQFRCGEKKSLYVYRINSSREVRVIEDNASDEIRYFTDGAPADTVKPVLMQYGLYYGKMIKGTTSDCGMCYFIRTRDNRIIMIDGGGCEQCTVPAVDDIMNKLHALTGTKAGEKVTITLWLCTHAHDDHFDMFTKLLKDRPDEIAVERIGFNFPADSVIKKDNYILRLKSRISEYAPDVRFIKMHTGQHFCAGGIGIDVLLTHEDIIQLKQRRVYDGMNGTSTVFRFTADKGSFIVLGDLVECASDELAARYRNSLSCTYLQAAHHCINDCENAYASIKREKVLVPQSEWDCLGRNWHKLSEILRNTSFRDCVFAGNGTDVFGFEGDAQSVEHYPTVGCPYDGNPL